jgi:hypothetical protein
LSSSTRDSSLTWYIATSLIALRQECPTAYFLMCSQLAPRQVRLVIDGESVMLAFDPSGVHVLPQAKEPTAELVTSHQTILDVLDARLTLTEAVLSDAIVLRGQVDDLTVFHDGLTTYVRGAVRCPTFRRLLDSFRYDASLARNEQDNRSIETDA